MGGVDDADVGLGGNLGGGGLLIPSALSPPRKSAELEGDNAGEKEVDGVMGVEGIEAGGFWPAAKYSKSNFSCSTWD